MGYSTHSVTRAQQRGIPPLMIKLVKEFGTRSYDHHGGIVRYLDKRARRAIEREIGTEVMRRLHEFADIYVVESADDGHVLTVGHRYERISRN
jgi:hypothetical protein